MYEITRDTDNIRVICLYSKFKILFFVEKFKINSYNSKYKINWGREYEIYC